MNCKSATMECTFKNLESIKDALFSAQDTAYRDFQSKLVPTLTAEQMIGVRTPVLREIAKSLSHAPELSANFLENLPHQYFEENLIHFFVVSNIKDFDTCIREVERFLPYVDSWPVCDQASPKAFKKQHGKLLPYIQKWIDSDEVYTARFGIRMLMNEFLGADFKHDFPEWVCKRTDRKGDSEDYYLKMMAAWYFATALAKQWDAVLPLLEKKRLEKWTHNKAIQKALESFRVSDEHKVYLRTLKV